jgi:putative membrane protein
MLIDLIFFITIGTAAGILMGMVPGIHPNTIILLVPLFISLSLEPLFLIAFTVSMAVSNIFFDFIPSILLGAPDADTELTVLPGHRMVLAGHGYDAVRLCVIGCAGAIVLCALLFPLIVLTIPGLYAAAEDFIWIFIIIISAAIIWSNKGFKKTLAILCFLGAGFIGLMTDFIPIDSTLILFPIFTGFFGISTLLLQMRETSRIPKQKKEGVGISNRTVNRSVVSGTTGGIVSGFLPGVGTSQITAMATLGRDERTFLITSGSIAAANTIISIISLWLISKPRSGVAVALGQMIEIGLNDVILIIGVSLLVAGLSVFLVLKTTRVFLNRMEKINYSYISACIIILLTTLTIIFTGIFGLLLLATSTSMGIFVGMTNVRRATLMGILIIPTIIFYMSV